MQAAENPDLIANHRIQPAGPFAHRIRKLWASSFLEKVECASELYWLLKTQGYYRRFFGRIGRRSRILNPMRLKNVENIFIGDEAIVNKYAFLLTLRLREAGPPRLVIGDGCVIGHMNHITAVREVVLGRKVLTADRVHISDNSHAFTNPDKPILDQEIISKGRVNIGEGTWIGENAVVLSCNIGRNCIVGSNAVVLSDVPDYCVVAGAPARIVRRLNLQSRVWEETAPRR